MESNETGYRTRRINSYIVIQRYRDMERYSPWEEKTNSNNLPSVEESLKIYEELMSKGEIDG